MNRKRRFLLLAALALLIAGGFGARQIYAWFRVELAPRGAMAPLVPKSPVAAQILAGAKAQIGTTYDASYQTISYPMGDVEANRGACTDVVIRALRHAGFDLQKRVHLDMNAHWKLYPKKWGLSAPNANIDHRRVPNQMVYFARFGRALPLETSGENLKNWQPGDIIYWDTGNGDNTRLHTGIVSDTRDARGLPFVIHNGSVCLEDDALDRWKIIGHFRFPR